MSLPLPAARLAAVAVSQCGAFSRAQAVAAGIGSSGVDRRVRAGEWVRVLPRVYRHAATPPTGALARWAAVLWAGPPCALSHTSAAALWSIPVPAFVWPEIVVPNVRAPRAAGVVVHRVARLRAGDVVTRRGLPVTSPARTLVDLAAVLGPERLEIAAVGACELGVVDAQAVVERLDRLGRAGRPGAGRLRAILTIPSTRTPIPPAGADRSDRMAW